MINTHYYDVVKFYFYNQYSMVRLKRSSKPAVTFLRAAHTRSPRVRVCTDGVWRWWSLLSWNTLRCYFRLLRWSPPIRQIRSSWDDYITKLQVEPTFLAC